MIKIRKHGTVVASFATPQEIVIDHANDDIRVGDGTDLMGPLQNVGGVLCFPVAIQSIAAGTLATSANQTNGSQKTQVADESGNIADMSNVGGNYALKVDVVSTVGGGAAPAHTDDAAFTVAVDAVTAIGGLFDDTGTDSVDEGDVGALRMTADRLLKIQIASILAGVAMPVTDNGGSITVDGTFWQATQPVSAASLPLPTGASTLAEQQTQTTALQLLDDMIATIAAAVPTKAAFVAGTDGTNAQALKTDASGELQIDVLSIAAGDNNIGNVDIASIAAGDNNIGNVDVVTLPSLPAGTNNIGDVDVLTLPALPAGTNNIGDVDIASAPTGASAIQVQGAAAHDAAVVGSPVRIGGYAMNTSVTKVANGDTANLITDLQGALVTMPVRPREFIRTQTTAITNTTETTVVTAGGAGVYNDIVGIIITNNSDVQSLANLKDSTAGTTRMTFLVPARGGVVYCPCTPLAQQAAANNNWTITMGTTATATNVSIQYVIQT